MRAAIEDTPYKTYKKTILGKVYVVALDPFSGQPTGYLMYGDPKRNDESCFISVGTREEDNFFRSNNKVHFKKGFLIESTRVIPEVTDVPVEQFSDEQLKNVINKKFLALQAWLNKVSSEIVIMRMVDLAVEMDKSAAIIRALEARLSEIQSLDVTK